MNIEKVILQNLLFNEDYMRKVIPFLKAEYFYSNKDKLIFESIKKFIEKYNTVPTIESIVIGFQNDKTLNDDQYKEVIEEVNSYSEKITNNGWLYNETEKFCKDKAIYNAILTSISIIDGKEKSITQDGIPSILQNALGVCFDHNVGHDYFENADNRFDF